MDILPSIKCAEIRFPCEKLEDADVLAQCVVQELTKLIDTVATFHERYKAEKCNCTLLSLLENAHDVLESSTQLKGATLALSCRMLKAGFYYSHADRAIVRISTEEISDQETDK